MLALFLFGIQLEQRMGSTEFLLYYFVCGDRGWDRDVVHQSRRRDRAPIDVVGASGAIFALLLAFAAFFPDARIFIFGILPMRAPVAVALYAGIEIFSSFTSFQSGVAHLTHLAGLAFGYLYLVVRYGMNPIAIFFRRR